MNPRNITITLIIICSVLYMAKTTTVTEEELRQILQDWKKQIEDEMFQHIKTIRSDVQENAEQCSGKNGMDQIGRQFFTDFNEMAHFNNPSYEATDFFGKKCCFSLD